MWVFDFRSVRCSNEDRKEIVKFAFTADEQISVCVHVESSYVSILWNSDASLPGDSGVSRPAKLTAAAAGRGIPILVLEAVARAVGFINGKPLFVSSAGKAIGLQLRPGLAAVGRAIYIVTECL